MIIDWVSLNFKFDKESNYQINVFDLTGKLVLNTCTESNFLKIDLSEFEKGEYIIVVYEKNVAIITKEIILQ